MQFFEFDHNLDLVTARGWLLKHSGGKHGGMSIGNLFPHWDRRWCVADANTFTWFKSGDAQGLGVGPALGTVQLESHLVSVFSPFGCEFSLIIGERQPTQ